MTSIPLNNIIETATKLAISLKCPNCDKETTNIRRVYCSERCRQSAERIRYHRRVHKDDRINREDVAEHCRFNKAVLYSEKTYINTITPKLRETILERDGRKCQQCGFKEIESTNIKRLEVHHLNKPEFKDNRNHPDNLQVLCSVCHRKESIGSLVVLDLQELPEEERLQKMEHIIEIDSRLDSESPLRLCDDEDHWDQYHLASLIIKERRKHINSMQEQEYNDNDEEDEGDDELHEDDRFYDEDYLRYWDY